MAPRLTTIGIIVPSLEDGGGVPAVAQFLCETIERCGRYAVRLFSLAVSAADPLSVGLTRPRSWRAGVRTEPGIWRGRHFIRVGAFASELEFQRFRPTRALAELVQDCDILQVVAGSPAWGCAALGLGKPVCVHFATRMVLERRSRDRIQRGPLAVWRRQMTRVTDRFEHHALRTADVVQTMNPHMQEFASGIRDGRTTDFAPPGVDAEVFTPAVRRDPLRDRYILCVGRLSDPRKNVNLLFDAFLHLPADLRASARVRLAGLSPPPAEFWRRVRDAGVADRFEFVAAPSPADLVELYRNAAVVAFPSDEEGFGMVALEAMACGIPVVATRSGGPEGIIDDGRDGFLVALDDARGMAVRTAELLRNTELNLRIGSTARESVLRRFALPVAGNRFLSRYEALAGRP